MYAREGIELDRALMADWMGKVVFLLTPLAEAIGRHIRAGEVFHADDTTVPVLSPGLGKTATGPAVGDRARRASMGFVGSARRVLSLLPGSQGRPRRSPAR